jgi:hypothetical protein
MARVLHVFKGDHGADAARVIARAVAAGDQVDVAVVGGAAAPAVPAAVSLHRVPDQLSYEALAELIFAADHVVTW